MALQFNLSALLREPVGSVREHDLDGKVLIDDAALRHQQVRGHARFLRTKQGVLVTGQLAGIHDDSCSRCLGDIGIPVSVNVEEEYLAAFDPDTGEPTDPPEDGEAFRLDDHHNLDVEEPIRQAWTAALPMQALCRDDCRGLCPRCGKDLNPGPCSCAPETDERWGGLQRLAGKLEGD